MAEIIEKTGKSYNIFDKVNNVWNKISFWHKASDCEFNDGKTAQTKLGAIDGITSDLSGESETVAASIKCVNQLNSSLPHIDTIWTRSNLLTTFTNQTIELLNLNTYDGIEIIWNGVITSGGTATQGTSTGFLPFSILTEENVYFSLRFVSSGSQIDVRDFSIDLVNNNITFTGSCGNNRCIPQKILGYKGFM